MAVQAWVGLGSNLGDKQANLSQAIALLRDHGVVTHVSSLYRTEPVGFLDQDWFLNIAVGIQTNATPETFLDALLNIEQQMGRVRVVKDGPRTIDLDLLFWDGQCLDLEGLTVPHPRLHLRHFVLQPLVEIAPDLRHPLLEKTISQLVQELGLPDGVQRVPTPHWPSDPTS